MKLAYILIIGIILASCNSDIEDFTSNSSDSHQSSSKSSPQNVDYFNIEVTRDDWVYNTFYISDLQQTRLSIREFSLVTYNWASSDPSVVGVIVSQINLDHLVNGVNYNSQYDTYPPSGSIDFGMNGHVTGSFTLYVKTYNANYTYSSKSKRIDVYIQQDRDYTIYQ